VPGLVLQVVALAVVVSYFQSSEVAGALDRLGALKLRWGYLYSAAATALFGGAIPFFALWALGWIRRERAASELGFYIAFWIWKGVEVDALYRGQAWLFGDHASTGAIAAKTAVDQLLYNPLWATPTQAICFLWKDSGFSFDEVRRRLRQQSLLRRATSIQLSGWVVWIPGVAIIYALPTPLQLPLFNLVLCFWCLLLTFVAKSGDPAESPG
jgi:hypothetical protein